MRRRAHDGIHLLMVAVVLALLDGWGAVVDARTRGAVEIIKGVERLPTR